MKVGRPQGNPSTHSKVIREGTGSKNLQKTADSISPHVISPHPLSKENPQGLPSHSARSEALDTIRILIRMINRDSPRQKALLPLLQLVRELPAERDGTPLDSRDRRLLQNVLREWRKRFGGELNPKIRSRLEILERQLNPGEGEGFYLFSGEPDPEHSYPRVFVEERRKASAGKPEGPLLILDMELPELGRVRSSLSGGDGGIECRIACDSGTTRRRLRRALPRLRKRLASFRLKDLVLGRIRKPDAQNSSSAAGKGRGIHLWG